MSKTKNKKLKELRTDMNEILKLFDRWSQIYPYLISKGYVPEAENREAVKRRKLTDSDTMIIALVLCRDFIDGDPTHTRRSLAKLIDSKNPKSIDNATRKIERLMDDLQDYNIFTSTQGNKEGKNCYYITPNKILLKFAKNVFLKK